MPQYQVGHIARIARIRARAAALGIHLAGNAYDGVGIPDCIRSGEDAAAALFASLPSA
jgi:oxygen-dependent protoporphyrinogen oxidase